MKYLVIFSFFFSLTMNAQPMVNVQEALTSQLSKKNKEHTLTYKVPDFLNKKKKNQSPIDLVIDIIPVIENKSIQYIYISNQMRTLGQNVFYNESTIDDSYKLYFTLENQQIIELKARASSFKYEISINYNHSTIGTRYYITKDDFYLLSKHRINTFKQVHSEKNEIKTSIPENISEEFRKSIDVLYQ